MATVRKIGKSWWIDYYINGKRYRKRIGKSRRIAELACKDIEVKIAKKRAGFLVEYKISDWLKEFYKYIEAHLRESTVKSYKKSLEYFIHFLETLPDPPTYLSEITPSIIEEFKMERLNQNKKKKTVNNDLSAVRRFLNLAVKRGYLEVNPFQKVEMLKLTDKKMPRFLTKEELNKIYEMLRGEDRDIVRVLANTGMRWGELRHLEWKDIDMENKQIKIREKILHTGGKWTPKTGENRIIPMNEVVYSILAKKQKTEGFVFTSDKGNMLHMNHVRERLQTACEKLGIENVALHTLRHTFISHLIMAGVDIPTVMKISGHRDIRVAQMYMHLARDHIRKAVDRISL